MKNKEHAAGEVFDFDDRVKLQARKTAKPDCVGCYFATADGHATNECRKKETRDRVGACLAQRRLDEQDVIFYKMGESRPVGEIFQYEDRKLQVKQAGEEIACGSCFFSVFSTCECGKESVRSRIGYCSRDLRPDRKNVVFSPVTDEKGETLQGITKEEKVPQTGCNEATEGNEVTLYVARDESGFLFMYNRPPVRGKDEYGKGRWETDWNSDESEWQVLEEMSVFADLEWEDEPVEVVVRKKSRLTITEQKSWRN